MPADELDRDQDDRGPDGHQRRTGGAAQGPAASGLPRAWWAPGKRSCPVSRRRGIRHDSQATRDTSRTRPLSASGPVGGLGGPDAHLGDHSAGAGRSGRGRGRLRPAPAPSCDPAQLPDHRALPLHARGRRTGAAAVHRHRQRRRAAVQQEPATLDLRVGEARGQHVRLRDRQRLRAQSRVSDRPPRGLSRAGARSSSTGPHYARALRQDRRRGARAAARVPAAVDRRHLGNELRRPVRELRSRR